MTKSQAKKIAASMGVAVAAVAGYTFFFEPEDRPPSDPFEVQMEKLQENYFDKHGHYLQIRKDGTIPSDMAATNTPATTTPFEVHVFERPDGHQGWKVIYEEESTTSSTST